RVITRLIDRWGLPASVPDEPDERKHQHVHDDRARITGQIADDGLEREAATRRILDQQHQTTPFCRLALMEWPAARRTGAWSAGRGRTRPPPRGRRLRNRSVAASRRGDARRPGRSVQELRTGGGGLKLWREPLLANATGGSALARRPEARRRRNRLKGAGRPAGPSSTAGVERAAVRVVRRALTSALVSSGPSPARNGCGCSIRRATWPCAGASAVAVAVVSAGRGTVRACERPPLAHTAPSARSRPRR